MKKYLLSTLILFSASFVIADGHTSAEKKVLNALETYFEARNNQDWETVVAYESNSGTYGTNSDGSFHKPVVVQSAQDWANSNQGGTLHSFISLTALSSSLRSCSPRGRPTQSI